MSLQPGDIISTGTPPGVGHGKKPPVYLRAGNVVRLGVEGLGEQQQTVVVARLNDAADASASPAVSPTHRRHRVGPDQAGRHHPLQL